MIKWKDGFHFVRKGNGNWNFAEWYGLDYNMPTGCSDVKSCGILTMGGAGGYNPVPEDMKTIFMV